MIATASSQVDESRVPPCEDADRVTVSLNFDDLYEELLPFVWRTARRMGVAPEAVEDVCQEVFVVVHRRLREYQGRSTIKTWVFGVLENVVRVHRRSLARKSRAHRSVAPLVDPAELPDQHPRPEEQVALSQAEIVAQRIFDEMDETKRNVFVLAEIEELGLGEVAAALGIPRSTVVARLRAARVEFAAGIRRARARDEWRLG
jgi:RNA polymerase sigma-70 factor (ECF subfamily)